MWNFPVLAPACAQHSCQACYQDYLQYTFSGFLSLQYAVDSYCLLPALETVHEQVQRQKPRRKRGSGSGSAAHSGGANQTEAPKRSSRYHYRPKEERESRKRHYLPRHDTAESHFLPKGLRGPYRNSTQKPNQRILLGNNSSGG